MAFLDFLKPKGNGSKAKAPDAQRADLDAALGKIAVERASAQLVPGRPRSPKRRESFVACRCAGERDREA